MVTGSAPLLSDLDILCEMEHEELQLLVMSTFEHNKNLNEEMSNLQVTRSSSREWSPK